jgi:hypothetical protein
MIWVVAGVAIAAALYGLHRLATWAEQRGWIYYRTKRGPAPWLGSLDAIYKPEIEHVVEEASAREIRADQDESGAGRDPGSKPPG